MVTTISNGFDVDSICTEPIPPDIEAVFEKYQHKFIVTYGGGIGYGIEPVDGA